MEVATVNSELIAVLEEANSPMPLTISNKAGRKRCQAKATAEVEEKRCFRAKRNADK